MFLTRMIQQLFLFTTSTRAFIHCTQNTILRSSLVTMSLSSMDLAGKTCVTVQDAMQVFGSAKFVDGSWFLMNRNGRQEYEKGPRIKGAEYFDIDDIASKRENLNPKNLPHMMPPKQLFAAAMDAMGITNNDHIILYGTKGCLATHRAWFQIRAMGHDAQKLHLMQGNLDDWIQLGGPMEEGPKEAIHSSDLDLTKPTTYIAIDPRNVLSKSDIVSIISQQQEEANSDAILIDARAKDRFLGLVEEPRPNMRLGHMPGALNMPFLDLLDPNDVTRFKPVEELKQLFLEAAIDVTTGKRLVISCGSGATACAVVAALEVCGRNPADSYVYDGSWAEWGGDQDTPIVKD